MVNNVSMLMCNDVSKPLKLDYKFARVDNSNRLDTFFFAWTRFVYQQQTVIIYQFIRDFYSRSIFLVL